MTAIVPMCEAHIPAVAAIGRECFSLPWSEEGYRVELRRESICLVAWEEGRVTGYITASVVLDEADIGLLAVTASSRRKGTAAALLRELLAACRMRGVKILHLEVRASNGAARSLYEKYGFTQDGLRRNYYRSPPEDAVLYSLRLAEGDVLT